MSISAPIAPGAARPVSSDGTQDPVLAAQQIFRQVLDGLASPGSVRPGLVHPAVSQDQYSGNRYLASVLLTLLDHEVSVHVDPATRSADELERLLARRTRVAFEAISTATFVVADVATVSPDVATRLRRGTLAYPDDGATLLLAVDALDERNSTGLSLHLSGPGIESSRIVDLPVGVDPALFEARNQAIAQYPLGIDLLLVDSAGRMVGLPRTTSVRIHQKGTR